jgi:hypothetical protein
VLKSIDLLIGLTVVMLVASMAVTVMTGYVNHLSNLRGRSLRQGIADLLRLIDPNLAQPEKISEAVLKHPLIRDAENRMGTVVHREELTKLLMELAAGNGPGKLEKDLQDRLAATLAAHGIGNPAATLEKIRNAALRVEIEHPELSNMARANIAILQEAESHFVAKINTWFDQTMDRVSQRFTISTRTVTFLCGVVLVALLQLDSIALVNRIYVDDELRDSLVSEARSETTQSDQSNASGDKLYNFVVAQGVVPLPQYPTDLARFKDARHLAGMAFTTLLLSLGAPFWYNALNQLLQLRPKIAAVDDLQRKSRESAKAATG